MTIASEIARLQGVKSDILGAIAEKKVDVPTGAMLADAPDLIRSIKSGINVKIGQGVYPAVKIGNQLWLAKNLDENLGNLAYDYTKKKNTGCYINTGVSETTVDLTPVSSSVYECIVIALNEGNKIKISTSGGTSARAYCFLGENNKIIARSGSNANCNDLEYTAPANGTLVINNRLNSSVQITLKAETFDYANEWYYNNDEATAKANNYGRLYTWTNVNENIGKLGLTKWRWPTKDDFDGLVALDPTGKKLRSKNWYGTDDFGFNAIRSPHRRTDFVHDANGFYCNAQTSYNTDESRILAINQTSATVFHTLKESGVSLRLVMDLNEDGSIPDSNIVIEEPATTAEPLALASEPIVEEE